MVRQFLLTNLGVKDDGTYFWKPNLNGIAKYLERLREFGSEKKQFQGETLFIGGGLSNYIRKEHYPVISQLFPQSKVVTVEGAGHWVHAQKPQQVTELIMQLIEGK